MPKLTPLKVAIFESRRSQRDIADALGIHETTFSSIVTGRLIPGEDRMEEIARELGWRAEDLWPDQQETQAAA